MQRNPEEKKKWKNLLVHGITAYSILGLDADANEVEIKKAYRLLSLKHHPDRSYLSTISEEHLPLENFTYFTSTHTNTPLVWNAIKEAYELLTNQNQSLDKARYDEELIKPEYQDALQAERLRLAAIQARRLRQREEEEEEVDQREESEVAGPSQPNTYPRWTDEGEAPHAEFQTPLQLIPEVDLYSHPQAQPISVKSQHQITLGDLHGNAMKLIYLLCLSHVFDLSQDQRKSDLNDQAHKELAERRYRELVSVYLTKMKDLTAAHINIFNTALNEASVTKKPLIRLIGDIFADRGRNDYYTLKVLEKLHDANVPVEILLSNHDLEFLRAYASGFIPQIQSGVSFFPSFIPNHQSISLQNLAALLGHPDIVSPDMLSASVERCYLPKLKLISYEIDPFSKKMFLYTHAPVGLKTIENLAGVFRVNFSMRTADELATTIDYINQAFQIRLNQAPTELSEAQASASKINNVAEFLTLSQLDKIDEVMDANLNFPLARLIWNRDYENQGDVMPMQLEDGTALFYVHGHDGEGIVPEKYSDSVINLDNKLGKKEPDSFRAYRDTKNKKPGVTQNEYDGELSILLTKGNVTRLEDHINLASQPSNKGKEKTFDNGEEEEETEAHRLPNQPIDVYVCLGRGELEDYIMGVRQGIELYQAPTKWPKQVTSAQFAELVKRNHEAFCPVYTNPKSCKYTSAHEYILAKIRILPASIVKINEVEEEEAYQIRCHPSFIYPVQSLYQAGGFFVNDKFLSEWLRYSYPEMLTHEPGSIYSESYVNNITQEDCINLRSQIVNFCKDKNKILDQLQAQIEKLLKEINKSNEKVKSNKLNYLQRLAADIKENYKYIIYENVFSVPTTLQNIINKNIDTETRHIIHKGFFSNRTKKIEEAMLKLDHKYRPKKPL